MSDQSQVADSRYFISTDKTLLDKNVIHHFLSRESYWAKGIRKELVDEIVENSPLCYGVYKADTGEQVGFARVITDFARFSWLADVFILPAHRKKRLGKRLIHTIVGHPKLKGTRFMLATADAHGLYSQYGFHALRDPKDIMIREANMAKILEGHGLV